MEKKYHIEELDQVLSPYLGPDRSVVCYTATPLTSPGENFGSLILAVKITVKNKETSEESELNVVAKMCPPNELIKEIFNVEVTFKREVNMYTKILNELRSFAEEYNFPEKLDFLCEYYSSRLSLDPNSTTVDDNAILLLENLSFSGFQVVDRFVGFDYEAIKVVLKELALFHGVPLAYKLKNPERFEVKLMPSLDSSSLEKKLPPLDDDMKKKIQDSFLRHAIEGNPKCAELSSKILKLNEFGPLPNQNLPLSHPYGTLCHLDLWVNNIMVKYVDDKLTRVKFIDFQMYSYDSLARDLVFLLFSSVKMSILDEHFDDLVSYYHRKLLGILEFFGCNCEEYSLDSLYAEIEYVLKLSEMNHILFMFKPILAEKGTIENIENISLDNILKTEVSDEYKKRIADVILFFAQRHWL